MESAMWSALVLLCGLFVSYSFCQVLDFRHAQPLPCFASCLCDSPDLITCNASLQFQQSVLVFNEFLRTSNAGRNSLVHIRTAETSLPSFLSQLPALHKLSLAENKIFEVQNAVFLGMRLQALNLSHNIIQEIQPDAFQDLHYLQMLDLSHNNLTSVSKLVFANLPYLEVLNLDFNQLMYFPFDAFSRVPSLQKLMLNENNLSYLMPGSLVSLSAVNILSLRNNMLRSFAVDVVAEIPSLKVLDVSGNPFHCACALRGLRTVLNSTTITLKKINQTTCSTPLVHKGKQISDIDIDFINCTSPNVTHQFVSQSVNYTANVEVLCDVEGNPDPAVLWVTPWGHHFADPSHWSQLEKDCHSCQQQRKYKGIGIDLVSTVSVLSKGKKLHITNFRSYFNGNITCKAFNFLGNDTAVHQVQVYRGLVVDSVRCSMIMGGFTAAGFFFLGLVIGGIKMSVLAGKKRFGKKKVVVLTPLVISISEEHQSLTEETHCKDDESFDSFSDDFYPPETPFTTPTAVSPTTSPRKIHTPENGEDIPPGGWLPTNIVDTMEEVRWRLRYGVGRKMQTVKRNVQFIKESGIRNVQSIKESGSVYVHNIMESGSTAANKVKAGVVMGMETVKYHVQSIKEFCGTGDMGTQTISMISVETNLDTNETREVVKSITIV
ncbi:uncharacterized protein LOC143287513 [Babylonia areolata]|uniref:uncharacterized protein LOC143287513 n=1 Tax=Babylonia areolata TaxID=304850 RepID=UPI003FD66C50